MVLMHPISHNVNWFFLLEFTQYKAEQPLRGMELQKKYKKIKTYGNLFRKNLHIKVVC